jgi:hypothetical protein
VSLEVFDWRMREAQFMPRMRLKGAGRVGQS